MRGTIYGWGSFTTPQFLNDIRSVKVAAMAPAMNQCQRNALVGLVEGRQLVLGWSIVISAVAQAMCCRVFATAPFIRKKDIDTSFQVTGRTLHEFINRQ
jgi:hypothetical protein